MVDMIREVERFGVFRMDESFTDLEVKRAMNAVWGVAPRAKELQVDMRRLPEIELVPRNQLSSPLEQVESFMDKAVDFVKGKDTAEA